MGTYAFITPVLPGRVQAWKDAAREMKTTRKADHDASRKRLGMTKEEVWHQQTPMGDFAVVFIEADKPEEVVGNFLTSQEPYDKWFRETVLMGVHGLKPTDAPPPLNERIF